MQTLGYRFRPWREHKPLADGQAILDDVRETARVRGVDRLVRFGHRVRRASWSSRDALWTVDAEHGGRTVEVRASFLMLCSGYSTTPKVTRRRSPVSRVLAAASCTRSSGRPISTMPASGSS